MANRDAPFGFVPTRPWETNIYRPMNAEAYSSNAIFIYDVVALANDGYIDAAAAQSTTICGVSMGKRSATDTAIYQIICMTDLSQTLYAQADESDISSIGYIGNCADHLATAGNTTLLTSAHEIDSSTVTGAAGGFRIIDKLNDGINDWGANVILEVAFCEALGLPSGAAFI